MPVYLAHGFRWPREGFTGIRVHAIIHNLDACSVEYIQNPASQTTLLESFRTAFPDVMSSLEGPPGSGRRIDFLEQYDPEDEESEAAVSQPYAFVCDRVLMIAGGKNAEGLAGSLVQATPGNIGPEGQGQGRISPTSGRRRAPTQPMSLAAPFNSPATCTALSVNVEDVIADGPGMSTQAWEAMADLRDKLAQGEKIGWWVVYNGDPERAFEASEDEEGYGDEEEEDVDVEGEEVGVGGGGGQIRQSQSTSTSNPLARDKSLPKSPSDDKEFNTPIPRSPTGGRVPPPVPPAVPPKSPPLSMPISLVSTPLPVREKGKRMPGMTASPEKERHTNEQIPEPAKLKEVAKSQGLRKKFFGKRA